MDEMGGEHDQNAMFRICLHQLLYYYVPQDYTVGFQVIK